MQLFFNRSVRRCVGLAIFVFFTVPFGLSVIGCGHKIAPPAACPQNGNANSGPVQGQAYKIVLDQSLSVTGESLNYGQIGQLMNAATSDCIGNSVSVTRYTYTTSNMAIADVNPGNGSVCAGTWNRNTGSGIPDFTICTPPANPPTNGGLAYVTAQAEGVTSNQIAVFVHPEATAVELATPQSSSGGCNVNDPTSDCCPNVITTTPENPAPGYNGLSCISQNDRVRLAAKVYSNGTNITCQVGPLAFAAQGSSNVVDIDAQGFAIAGNPGSAIVTATIAGSTTASNAGFFSTCPPASIVIAAVGQGTQNPLNVALNTPQPLTATVFDTNVDAQHPNGHQITSISLQWNSTTPQTISATSGTILANFPGSTTVTAVCEPGSCNPSPLPQIGYLGNGKPITSNGITANAAGSSGTVIYMASTDSQYVVPYDFTLNQQGSAVKLPYVPNSMVMSQDGLNMYFGSSHGLMTFGTSGNTASAANQLIPGNVLAVSPDGSTIVVTDPTRQSVSLVSGNTITATYGNVIGTSAAWSPDSQTVYITTNNPHTMLTHSSFNGWQVTDPDGAIYTDVTVMVPHVGAYFAAGNTAGTDGRTYCSTTSAPVGGGNGNPPTTTNIYYPVADPTGLHNQVLASTTDGKHILGTDLPSGGSTPVLNDLALPSPLPQQALDCTTASYGQTVTFPSSPTSQTLAGITVTPEDIPGLPSTISGISQQGVTGIVPATNSALAFVTYNGSSGLLPEYIPSTGKVNNFQLGNGATSATAPLSGVFSTDNLSFYVGDSDGIVHVLSINGTTPTETRIIQPALPNANGSGNAPVNLIAQKPKKLQS